MTLEQNEEEPHYLLDSNIVSEIIKSDANFNVLKKLVEHNSDCAICAPTWHEMLYGLCRMPEGAKKKFLSRFIESEVPQDFSIKYYTSRAAEIHAKLRAMLEKNGKTTQKDDTMIAAIALSNRMILVTRNAKHFEAIQEVSDLQVENWFGE